MNNTLTFNSESANSPRTILNFNDNWGYYRKDLEGAQAIDFDDSDFAPVSIPHTMRLEKNPAGDVKDVFQGVGWYRRYFTLDEKYKGKQIRIDFESVMMDCDVYLNGEKLGEHHGGYMEFSIDITNKVDFEKTNVLALRVVSEDNFDTPPGKPLGELDFHYYGGIYRNIYLRITDNIFVTNPIEANEIASGGVFITYPEVSRDEVTVCVKTHIQNENVTSADVTVKTIIIDSDNNAVAETDSTQPIESKTAKVFNQTLHVKNPSCWCPDTPHLYTVKTEVYLGEALVDCVDTTIGIRRIEMKPDGFYINGERLFLRGANRHQCYAYIGDAASDSMQMRDALQMKDNGFNSVRAAHYPQSPAFLDMCDKIGLLVIECQPGWQQFTETDAFYNNTIRDAREMVRRDRNHPSVFLWEASLNETHYTAEWAKEVTEAAHEEYPGDQFFTAADYGLQGEYYDVNYKAIDGEKDNAPDKTVFTREWGDMGGYHQWKREHGEYFQLWQTETHQYFLEGNGYPDWGGLDAGDRIAGYYMWSWNDYARGYNSWMLPSGCVEVDRTEKYLAFWLKSMLPSSKNPMVFIANRNNAISGRTVRVFSNCDTVELYQNKKLIGRLSRTDKAPDIMLDPLKVNDVVKTYLKKRKIGSFVSNVPNVLSKGGSPIFNFCLPYLRRGTLTAKGYCGGKMVAEHIVKSPKIPAKIEIVPYTRGIEPVADGSDLIPVHFKVVDKNGTLVTSRNGKINISVSGEGELVGKNIDRINVERQNPSAGVAFAFVRTTKNAGEITISAKLGNVSGTTTIKTQPYNGAFVPDGEHKAWVGGEDKLETEEILALDTYRKEGAVIGSPLFAKDIKSVTSSCECEEGRGPEKLFDGEAMIGTGWLAKTDKLPQSVTVTFKKPKNLTACTICWEKDSSWYTFEIEVSQNGKEWQSVFGKKSVGGQAIQPHRFLKTYKNTKYARITLHDVVSSSGIPRTGMAEVFFYAVKQSVNQQKASP